MKTSCYGENMVNKYFTKSAVFLCIYLLSAMAVWAQESVGDQKNGGWPREIEVPEGVVIVYQPQPESLNGNLLKGRTAVSVEIKGAESPVFGAVWFEAQLDTDRAERTANISKFSVSRVRFPTKDEKKSKRLVELLEKELPQWQFAISMDQLMLTLEREEKRSEKAENISTKPPKIIFINEPAVLISIDGEPRLKEEADSGLMRVINTPYTILFEPSTKHYYLNADEKQWYSADDIKGDWQLAMTVPDEVAELVPEVEAVEFPDDSEDGLDEAQIPKIIVSTEPAELISATGDPEFIPIDNTDLLYVSNTDSDVFKNIKDQNYYVLLSGRWYASSSLKGPWEYVAGEDLPEDFSRIPEDSELGTVLYAVPGTNVAEEAVLDAQIPQTAVVDRKKAMLSVEYDGDPEFKVIDGTSLSYATNTEVSVIKVKKKYYAVDDAVWFVSDDAKGSWKVATSVPDEIYVIPPEASLYHVTFVRIYKVTDDEIYIGYTPGYTGTYVYNTTIVYGTGYYWPGWYGHRYYPRRSTWGYHVRWNPHTGFRFGLSYSSGPFTFSIGRGSWYRGGWWGPSRYRGYSRGYRHGHRAGYRSGYRAGQRNAAQNNIYRSQNNKARMSAQFDSASNRAKGSAASKRANNVFADKDGNIHRKSDKGWEQRTSDGWKSESSGLKSKEAGSKQKPSQTGSGQKPSQTSKQKPSWHSSNQSSGKSLEKSSQTRQRGAQRSSGHKSSGGGARGGGMRGGGGRR